MTTYLLVHGAWHGAWCWDELAPKLGATATVELPSKGPERGDLYADAATVREAIDAIDGPVVVVAHSYAGAVVTEGAVGVEHIVYVTAFMLGVGESLLGTVGGVAPDWWDDNNLWVATTEPGATGDEY